MAQHAVQKGGLNVLKKVMYDPTKFVIKEVVVGNVVETVSMFDKPVKIIIGVAITIVVVGEAIHLFYSLPAYVQSGDHRCGTSAFKVVSDAGSAYSTQGLAC